MVSGGGDLLKLRVHDAAARLAGILIHRLEREGAADREVELLEQAATTGQTLATSHADRPLYTTGSRCSVFASVERYTTNCRRH
jgi:hypothetical protein